MKNKKSLVVIIVILLLGAAVAVLAILNRPSQTLDAEKIAVLADGETVAVLEAEQLASLTAAEFSKELVSANHDNQGGVWTGVPLCELLDSVIPDWQERYATVCARAEDNYLTSFSKEEVLAADDIYVCWMLDGEPLGSKAAGGTGPFRIIVRNDEFAVRCASWLCRLELE